MEELEKLICDIEEEYDKISAMWKRNCNYLNVNLGKNTVNDIYNDELFFEYLIKYREFLITNLSEFENELQKTNFENTVNSRIKTINSVQLKINAYEHKKEHGKIPLKKCLNDLFGVRIILKENLDFDEIINYINKNYQNLKCTNASKMNYKAIHIYYGRDDNFNFQWELQIWNKKNESTNLISHAKHKQEYTDWEKRNRGDRI